MDIKRKLKTLVSRRTKACDKDSGSAAAQPDHVQQEELDANSLARKGHVPDLLSGQSKPSVSKSTPASKASDTPIDELWSLSYEHLRESDGDLINDYEEKLRGNFAIGLGSMLGSRADVREKMNTILQRKMDEVNRDAWKLKFRSSEVQVKDLVQPVLGVVNWANEYVSAALGANPSASIAWASVSLLLPLFLNPSKQAVALAKGLEQVSSLIARSYMWESLYIRRCQPSSGGKEPQHSPGVDPLTYKDALEMLYQHILRFQITSYSYYASNTALRLSQDMIQWNEWQVLLGKIRDQEVNFAAVNATWRDSIYAEECLAAEKRHEEAIFQWQHIGKDVSGLLKAVQNAREEEKRNKLLQWLCTVDPSEAYNTARNKHIGGTSDWLLRESDQYKNWERTPSSLLWLHGKAGCGKSILSSSVINDIKDRYRSDPQTALAYFFFSFSDSSKQKVDVMLASLVKQLYASRPDTPPSVESLEGYRTRGERPDTKTLEAALMATTRGFAATFIIIDALDECPSLDGEREKLMTSFCRIICAIPNNVHVLCTSRAEADIAAAMSNILCATQPTRVKIDLNEQRRSLNHDIALYIEATLASPAYSSWPPNLKEEAKGSLIENAEGMFQYVSSQFEDLQKLSSTKAVRAAIQRLPVGLDATYDRILLSLEPKYRTQIASSLQWLAASTRDLTVEELAEVFILHPDSDAVFDEGERLFKPEDCVRYLSNLVVTVVSEDKPRYWIAPYWDEADVSDPIDNMESVDDGDSVNDWESVDDGDSTDDREQTQYGAAADGEEPSEGESFGDVDSSYQPCSTYSTYVRLAHFTVKEYLISDRVTQGPAASFSFTETGAHLRIALSSLPYHLHCQNLSKEATNDFKLTDYTYENWAFHLEKVPRELWLPDLSHLVLRGLAVRSTRERLAHVAGMNSYVQYASIFDGPHFYTAGKGFPQLTELLLGGGPGTNPYLTQNDLNMTLRKAAEAGSIPVVHLLLAKGADLNAENEIHGGVLQAAVDAGHKEVVELLLDSGADVAAHPCEWGHVGRACHQLDVVQLLLNRGADVECSPLILACKNMSHESGFDFLRILLDGGTDMNKQCDIHGTALHQLAMQMGSHGRDVREAFYLLLDRGADVNLPGGKYGYPLQALCGGGAPKEDVMLLLNRGANINACGGEYGSALQALFGSGHSLRSAHQREVAELLLERGSDVNMKGGKFASALHAACASYDVDAVRFLLENGADVSIQDLHAVFRSTSPSLAITRLLLDKGVDVNTPGRESESALQVAARWVQYDRGAIVRLLLSRGADVNAQGGHYGNALQAACTRGNVDHVRILLDHGADVNAKGGHYGTPLQAACTRGNVKNVRILLDRGADVNAEGGHYGTALQAACQGYGTDIVRLLLDHGADVNAVSGKYRTALQAAFHNDHLQGGGDNARLLIERGADIHLHGGGLGNAWHARAAWARDGMSASVEAVLDLLLDHGVDIDDVRGGQHGTALQEALELKIDWWYMEAGSNVATGTLEQDEIQGRVDRVRYLLKRGANVNAGGGKYAFPIQSACAKEHGSRLTRLLLDTCPNVDVNATGGLFGTALQAAAHSRQEDSVRLLLDKGADINARGGRYGSALNAAVFRGFWEIVEVLLDRGAKPDSRQFPEPDEQWLAGVRDTFADEEWISDDFLIYREKRRTWGRAPRREFTEKQIARIRVDAGRAAVERYRNFWEKTRTVGDCVRVSSEI